MAPSVSRQWTISQPHDDASAGRHHTLHLSSYADVTPSRRFRIVAVVARSIAVQAIAKAPSTSAWSAAGVTQWAANSGWWFVAGSELMPILGWMDGRASDTLPISVEPPGRDGAVGSGKTRPRASAL